MKRLQCKIGDRFGYWTVIDNTPTTKHGHTHVKVQCKCGKIQESDLNALKRGKATGCRSCKAQDRKIPIKIGEIYKDWKVIYGPKVSKHQNVQWKVSCNCCGITTRWIQGNELVNPNKCFCCQKCASKNMFRRTTKERGRIGDLNKTQYTRLQRLAETRNIKFNLSIKYLWNLFILQKRKCALTGDSIENIREASLDRINSDLGYLERNVQWTTKQANISKHTMSQKDLITFCEKVINHANQQPSQGNPL